MKIEICTLFDCLIILEEEKYVMRKNFSKIEIEMAKEEEVSFLVYPTENRNLLSYACIIKNREEKPLLCCPYAKTICVFENEYEIELFAFDICVQKEQKIEKTNILGYQVGCMVGTQNYFCVENGFESFFEWFDGKVLSYSFKELESFPAVFVKLETCEFLIVFDANKNEFKKFEAQKIEFEETQVLLYQNYFDQAKHGNLKKLVFNQEGYKELANELLFLESSPKICTNKQIVPIAFFEAVKIKNFSLAKSYLSENLSGSVTMDMLEEYFGEFEKVKRYNFKKDKGYYVNLMSKTQSKIFRIKMNLSKIDEIELISSCEA